MKEKKEQIRLAIIKGIQKNHNTEQFEEALSGAHILEGRLFTEESSMGTYYTRSKIVEPRDYIAGTLCARRNRRWTGTQHYPLAR